MVLGDQRLSRRAARLLERLGKTLRLIAQRGDFIGRKGDGEPGAKSLWIGLQQVAACIAGMRYGLSCG